MSFDCLAWFVGGIVVGVVIMLIVIVYMRNKAMKQLEKVIKEMDVKTIEHMLKGKGEKK
jgi:uncharacterized membrane protein (DUF106 family)